jgi:hypothetical protein
MYEWNIDDTLSPGAPCPDSTSSCSDSALDSSATAAALFSAADIEHAQVDLLMRTRKPSFAGKLLRTCIILAACSLIAALLPQIQVLSHRQSLSHQRVTLIVQVAFGLFGSTVSTCTAHAFPGALCLKMATTASGSTGGHWYIQR